MDLANPIFARRWAILGIAMALSGVLLFEAAELGLGWYWGRSSDISLKLRAAELLRNDALSWQRLGRAVEFDFDNPNPARAIGYYRQAVKYDPHSAANWMALAGAYEATGEIGQANAAFENAHRNYPISAAVSWKYGNFLLRHGQEMKGLEKIRGAIATDASLTPLAISELWHLDPHVHVLLLTLPPADNEARIEALDFLAASHETNAALAVWERVLAVPQGSPIRLSQAFPLLDELIVQGRSEDARQVWREALAASGWPQAPPAGHSLVWNGGFEAKIAQGGLGWRIAQVPGAYVTMDRTVCHTGKRSLRVDFTGGMNLDYSQVEEFVPVSPKTSYRFEAFLRTDAISTESGMRFEVTDPEDPQHVSAYTRDLTGTNQWTPVRAKITTGAHTHFLQIILRRFPSRLFDNKLGGTVWVDNVSLVPLASAAPQPQP